MKAMFSKSFFSIGLLTVVNLALAINCFVPSGNGAATAPGVEIRRTLDGQLAAVIKNHPDFPRSIFLLQSPSAAALSAPIVLTNVSIEANTGYVRFASRSNGEYVIFRLPDVAVNVPDGSSSRGDFSGYGLIGAIVPASVYDNFGGSSGSTYPSAAESVTCNCNANGSQPANSCTSGGAGSTSCSQSEGGGGGVTVMGTGGNANSSSSCSVTCGAGYYACCTVQ